jgi:hypothetical protein
MIATVQLGMIWKWLSRIGKTVMANFLEKLRTSCRIISEDSGSPGRGVESGDTDYGEWLLPTMLRISKRGDGGGAP